MKFSCEQQRVSEDRPQHDTSEQYICPICNESVELETAKTDEDGHVVHEDCYADELSRQIPAKPPSKDK